MLVRSPSPPPLPQPQRPLCVFISGARTQIRCQVYGLVGMQPRARRELLSREEETFVQRLFVALGDHLTDEVLAQVPEKYSAGIEKSMGESAAARWGVPA